MNTRVAESTHAPPVHQPARAIDDSGDARPSFRLLISVVLAIALRSEVSVRSRIHFLVRMFSRRRSF